MPTFDSGVKSPCESKSSAPGGGGSGGLTGLSFGSGGTNKPLTGILSTRVSSETQKQN